MTFKRISASFSAAPQLTEADVASAAQAGFRTIIDNRPDGEEPGQPSAAEMAAVAQRHGLVFAHIPVTPGAFSAADIARTKTTLAEASGPVLGYCRSGARAATMWALAQVGEAPAESLLKAAAEAGYDLSGVKSRLVTQPAALPGAGHKPARTFDVVIVGGGSAGIATASSLLKRNAKLSIAIVEPANEHFYQPGWTMVGAGIFTPEQTRHTMQSAMPDQVDWIRQAAAGFALESNEVILADGSVVAYRVLVAAPGLKLDWDSIPGLTAALGQNGVTSNYRFDLAPYTWRLVQEMKSGKALFTQPPMPIKCAGAPQKALYLSGDHWLRHNRLNNIEIAFHNAGAVLFGVKDYVPALMEYIRKYRADLRFESRLVAIDGPGKMATFSEKGADGQLAEVTRPFDFIHVCPPQIAPDFVRESPLAGPAGWIDVDDATMRHKRFENVFALGDVGSTPNAKTVAAARKQAPIVAENVLATLDGKALPAAYDGYGSCPLTVERGKIVLAEFGYGGKLLPSFPTWVLDGTRPTRAAWFLKERMLPEIYWHGMLKGREWMASPQTSTASIKAA